MTHTPDMTRKQLLTAQGAVVRAMCGIRSVDSDELTDRLMTLYLEGFKAGVQSRKEATNDTQN